jgi:hypothetical protein
MNADGGRSPPRRWGGRRKMNATACIIVAVMLKETARREMRVFTTPVLSRVAPF